MKLNVKTYFFGFLFGMQSLLMTTAYAGNTYHNIPGAACGAFNNDQADRLQRDHVRIYLPFGAPATYIVCPWHRVQEDMASTANPPSGWINVYFDEGVPNGTSITCVIRLFDYFSTHFPGRAGTQAPREALNVTAMKTAATGVAEVDDVFFTLADNTASSYAYYTATCPLVEGTGVNSFDFHQQ